MSTERRPGGQGYQAVALPTQGPYPVLQELSGTESSKRMAIQLDAGIGQDHTLALLRHQFGAVALSQPADDHADARLGHGEVRSRNTDALVFGNCAKDAQIPILLGSYAGFRSSHLVSCRSLNGSRGLRDRRRGMP